MKKALLYSIILFLLLFTLAFTTRITTSMQSTIAPFLLRASQQQGTLTFPDNTRVTPQADDKEASQSNFSDSDTDDRIQTLFRLINEHRVANGKHELVFSPEVTISAESHAEYLGEINECKHDSGIIGEELPIIHVSDTGFDGYELRENLSCGTNDPQLAFEGWRSSTGHNSTMLARDATHIGIGLNAEKGIYVMKIARANGVTPGQNITGTPRLTVTPSKTVSPIPSVSLTVVPTSNSPAPSINAISPTVSSVPLDGTQTRQVDWVHEGQGLCWSAWAGNQCSLEPHEGGATSMARDLNHDGQPDISCSQGNGSNQTTTVTNTSDRSITLSCERYACNQCATGNGTHAQCDGAIDPNSNRISEEVLLEPGCSLTCTFSGIVGNCSESESPDSNPTPTQTPTPQVTFGPSISPTPTEATPQGPTPDPAYEEETARVSTMISEISIDNIRSYIEQLVDDDTIEGTDEQQTRYTGSEGNDTEAAYISSQLESFGYTVSLQSFDQVDSILSQFTCPAGTEITNITATLPGSDSEERYLLTGHYDSISEEADYDPAPGADDNASGTATVLETARVLAQAHQQQALKHPVEIVLFDAEELGLCGSSYYVSQLDASKKESIKGVFNIDMIGFSPDTEKCTYTAYNGADTRSLDLVKRIATMNDLYGLQTTGFARPSTQKNSDHASFWNSNIPAIMLSECYPDQNTNYHKTTDRIGSLHFEQIEQVAQSVIATIGELALGIPYRDTLVTPTSAPQPTAAQPTVPPNTTPQPTQPPATGSCTLTTSEQEMTRLVNEYRGSQGIAALSTDCRLTEAARRHAEDQAAMTADQTATTSPHCTGGIGDGRNCPQGNVMTRVQATGYRFLTIQENIYAGTNPQRALDFWKNSTGHNNVLTSRNPTHIGIGVSDFGIVLVIATPEEGYTISPPNGNTSKGNNLFALLISVFN